MPSSAGCLCYLDEVHCTGCLNLKSSAQTYSPATFAMQRAISDYWGIIINVVTSDQHNW